MIFFQIKNRNLVYYKMQATHILFIKTILNNLSTGSAEKDYKSVPVYSNEIIFFLYQLI